jgi:hypothetical protein
MRGQCALSATNARVRIVLRVRMRVCALSRMRPMRDCARYAHVRINARDA